MVRVAKGANQGLAARVPLPPGLFALPSAVPKGRGWRPGGSHGLQNRCVLGRPWTGGFDSLALPPRFLSLAAWHRAEPRARRLHARSRLRWPCDSARRCPARRSRQRAVGVDTRVRQTAEECAPPWLLLLPPFGASARRQLHLCSTNCSTWAWARQGALFSVPRGPLSACRYDPASFRRAGPVPRGRPRPPAVVGHLSSSVRSCQKGPICFRIRNKSG